MLLIPLICVLAAALWMPVDASSDIKPVLCHVTKYSLGCPHTSTWPYNYTKWFHEHKELSVRTAAVNRVVLSYGHNGLGNMIWQHTIAQQIADELGANMYIEVTKVIPETGEIWDPPNTASGKQVVQMLLNPEYFWDKLPENHPHKVLCRDKNVSFYDRPKDVRSRVPNVHKAMLQKLSTLAGNASSEFCLVLLGYFQNIEIDAPSTRLMWKSFDETPLKRVPRRTDMGLYLRCTHHYPLPTQDYVENILNNTFWRHLYVMYAAPDCRGPRYQQLIQWMKNTYGAILDDGQQGAQSLEIDHVEGGLGQEDGYSNRTTYDSGTLNNSKWNVAPEIFDIVHDISMLSAYNKLIIPKSSFAFWGGFFSDASEVHVNIRDNPMIKDPKYLYYDTVKHFVGRFILQGDAYVFAKFKNISQAFHSRGKSKRQGQPLPHNGDNLPPPVLASNHSLLRRRRKI